MAYAPTHEVPAGGVPAWTGPDGSQPPAATLTAGLDVQVIESRGQWARIACSNGWEGWVDGSRLVARASAAPPVSQPVVPEAPIASPVIPDTPSFRAEAAIGPEVGREGSTVDASAEPAGASGGDAMTHVVPSEGLPMWADPDPSQAALATLAGATELRVVEQRGQWASVELANGWTGWVDATRLTAKPAPALAAPAFGATHVAPAGGLPAWSAPDPSQPVGAHLAEGTELKVVEQRGQWSRVEASNGWWGWVDGARLAPRA